jgi:4-amino-4-deoxy-L-arabinose transferase-like glycosyltransferase
MAAVPPRSVLSSGAEPSRQYTLRVPNASVGRLSRIVQTALAFMIALIVLGLGIRAPFVKDAEPQSAQWIADVVKNGNWLVPRDFYNTPNPKPPLFYWLSALVTKTTGGQVDEARARTVSLVAGAALAAEVMAWTAVRLGPSGGWLAFTFLLGTYGFAVRAKVALTDMLLTILLFSTYVVLWPLIVAHAPTVSLRRSVPLGLPHDCPRGEAPMGSALRGRTVWAGILLGLAILTKGPVGAVLLALAIVIFFAMLRANPLRQLTLAWPWTVLAVGVAVACSWYVPVMVLGDAANPGGVFLRENLGHFLPASVGGTGEAARPFYYIGLRIIGGSVPLSLLIPAVALSYSEYKADRRLDLLYQLSMALAVLLLFSLASAKRDDYILPALPPLAILFAAIFVRPDTTDVSDSRLAAGLRDAAVAGSAVAIILAILAILLFVRGGGDLRIGGIASSDQSYMTICAGGVARLDAPFIFFGLLVMIGASVALAGVLYRRPLVSGTGFGLVCVASTILWLATVKPQEASTRSVAAFAAKVHTEVGNASIYGARPDPEMAWYYGRAIPVIQRAIAVSGPAPGQKTYFVSRPSDLDVIAPSVRQRMQLVIQSHVLGAGGPPALYLLQLPK